MGHRTVHEAVGEREATSKMFAGCSTTSAIAIVHFGSVGRLQGLFERSKAHPARG